MRTASFAKLSLTALVGLGSLVVHTELASAGPAPKGGTILVNPTTSTTMKPKPIVAAPLDYCDLHLCLEADPGDPQPDPPFDPDLPIALPEPDDCDQPSCDKAPVPQDEDDPDGCSPLAPSCGEIGQPDPGCNLTHGCPDETPCSEEDDARTNCDPGDDQPCSEQDHARTNCDQGDDPCRTSCDDGGTTGGTDGGTTGETDGGTTGGGGGRLPHTGIDVMGMAAIGLGLTGVGAAIKRLGRRQQ